MKVKQIESENYIQKDMKVEKKEIQKAEREREIERERDRK